MTEKEFTDAVKQFMKPDDTLMKDKDSLIFSTDDDHSYVKFCELVGKANVPCDLTKSTGKYGFVIDCNDFETLSVVSVLNKRTGTIYQHGFRKKPGASAIMTCIKRAQDDEDDFDDVVIDITHNVKDFNEFASSIYSLLETCKRQEVMSDD